MISKKYTPGFSTVELLITLFIGAAFLITGYQLFAMIIKDGGESRLQTRAYNAAEDYQQRYKSAIASPNCAASTPVNNVATPINGLSNTNLTVAITCPYGTTSPVSKITVTLKYKNPQQTLKIATYATP